MCHKTEKLQLNRQYHRTANRLIYRKSNGSSLQFADSYIKVVFQSFILSGRIRKLSFIVTAVFQYFVKSSQRLCEIFTKTSTEINPVRTLEGFVCFKLLSSGILPPPLPREQRIWNRQFG